MPTYEMKCSCSDEIQEIWASMSEYDRGLLCKCGAPLTRVFITAPALHGAENPEYKLGGREKADLPINIIDKKPGGGYKVTRIGKKKDIDND